ncbi:MAG: SRPBCC family protein [Thermoanaerobaculia bacterium]
MATAPAQTPTTLRITRTYAAPREKVFRAWTEPQTLGKWFAPSDEYRTAVTELDVRPGGRYNIEMRHEGKVYSVRGIFRVVRPPEKLVFTWQWENEPDRGDAGDTLVTVDLFDRAGRTELVLTHERFPSETLRDEHEKGWTGCLGRLERLLGTGGTR